METTAQLIRRHLGDTIYRRASSIWTCRCLVALPIPVDSATPSEVLELFDGRLIESRFDATTDDLLVYIVRSGIQINERPEEFFVVIWSPYELALADEVARGVPLEKPLSLHPEQKWVDADWSILAGG